MAQSRSANHVTINDSTVFSIESTQKTFQKFGVSSVMGTISKKCGNLMQGINTMGFFRSVFVGITTVSLSMSPARAVSFDGKEVPATFRSEMRTVHAFQNLTMKDEVLSILFMLSLAANKRFIFELDEVTPPNFLIIMAKGTITDSGKLADGVDRKMRLDGRFDHINFAKKGCNLKIDNNTKTGIVVMDTSEINTNYSYNCILKASALFHGVKFDIDPENDNFRDQIFNLTKLLLEASR